jgi:hypothetical protein
LAKDKIEVGRYYLVTELNQDKLDEPCECGYKFDKTKTKVIYYDGTYVTFEHNCFPIGENIWFTENSYDFHLVKMTKKQINRIIKETDF